MAGWRFDQALAALFGEFSRSRLTAWMKSGELTVNGVQRKPSDKATGGEQLCLQAQLQEQGDWQAQAIALQIVYEDDAILVIDKPAGLVVHPGAGNSDGTLVNALLHHAPGLALLPRAGLVHRIDKDTTGLLVVAKSLAAHTALADDIQEKRVRREYQTIVCGVMTVGGTVDAPIARHHVDRTRMCVREGGRPSVTHYRVSQRFRGHSHVQLQLDTGRTHQIRVHMAHIGYPIVGDPVYGGRARIPAGASAELIAAVRGFSRQALHAFRLALEHPLSGEELSFESPLPDDMQQLLAVMKADMSM